MRQISGFNRGFSLLELLVVVTIISLLAVISIPAFSAIAGARNMVRGAYDLASVIEQARNEAVTRQTYVWVGIKPVETITGREIQVAIVGSKDGTGTNTAQDNLTNLSKVLRIANASLTDWSGLKVTTRNLFTKALPDSVSANDEGITFVIGRSEFKGTTLTFTPKGEVLLKGSVSSDDGFNSLIDVSFRQVHGKTVKPEADDVSVLIEGATGAVRIVCLH